MAVISVDYKEGSKSKKMGYKRVELHYDNFNKIEYWDSGDFVLDWYNMVKFIIQNEISNTENISHSSSLDHFIMDGAPYCSAYLNMDKDNKPYLVYGDDEGIELFVHAGTQPTWEELKEYVKSYEFKK